MDAEADPTTAETTSTSSSTSTATEQQVPLDASEPRINTTSDDASSAPAPAYTVAEAVEEAELVAVDVYLPPASKVSTGLKGHDHTPFIIDLCTNDRVVFRTYRKYPQLLNLHNQLLRHGIEFSGFPERKWLHLGGIFGTKFTDTEDAEQRRAALAVYLNNVLGNTKNDPKGRNIFLAALNGRHLRSAILDGDLTAVSALLTNWQSGNELADMYGCAHDSASRASGQTALHLAAQCAGQGLPGSVDILRVLLQHGGDVNLPSNTVTSAIGECLSAIVDRRAASSSDASEQHGEELRQSNDAKDEVAYDAVLMLLQAGADVGELLPSNQTILHVCATHYYIVHHVAELAPRLVHLRNADGQTPLDLVLDNAELEPVKLALLNHGASRGSDVFEIDLLIAQEVAKLDEFLSLASQNDEHREQVAAISQMSDLYLPRSPIDAAKLLACALRMARTHDIDDEIEILHNKLLQIYTRVFSMFNKHEKPYEPFDRIELSKKHQRELSDVRANIPFKVRHSSGRELLQWLSLKFEDLVVAALKESVSSIAEKPPCSYAFFSIGPLAQQQCTPSSRIEFGIVIERASMEVFEYFRLVMALFELRIINLLETDFPVLHHRTLSPIAAGLKLDYLGTVPFRSDKQLFFRLIDTPEHLALWQENTFFEIDSSVSLLMAESTRFLAGDGRLYDAYRAEVSRILDRKQDTKKLRLRQQRALKLIRNEVEAFRPIYNAEPNDRKFFDIRSLLSFPNRIIRLLAFYFGAATAQQTNIWDLVDVLVARGILSRAGGDSLHRALSDAISLFVIVGEKTLVDIRDVVELEEQDFAAAAAQATSSSSSSSSTSTSQDENGSAFVEVALEGAINTGSEDRDPESSNTAPAAAAPEESAEVEIEVEAKDRSEAGVLTTKKLRVKDLYKLTKADVKVLVDILQVIIPLWNSARAFSESNEAVFAQSSLHASDNRTLAEAYFRLNLYRYAEKYYLAAALESPDDSNLINLIGAMWNKVQNYQKALEYYERTASMKVQQQNEGPELASVYSNLAIVNINLGRNVDAISWLEKALEIDTRVFGKYHAHVAKDNHYLGRLCHRVGQFEKAIEYLNTAILIHAHEHGDYTSQAASYTNDLGAVFFDMGQSERAIVYFSRALEIDKAVEGEIHPKVALRLQRIGETYVKMHQYQSALEFYERAAAINLKIYNEDHPRHAEDLFNIGIVCYRLELLERSLEHLRKTLDIYTRVLQHDRRDRLVVEVENAIARVEEALARKQMSPEEYEEWKRRIAEERLRRSLGHNSSTMWELQDDGKEEREDEPIVIKTPNVYSSGEIGKAQTDVIDDEFFEL